MKSSKYALLAISLVTTAPIGFAGTIDNLEGRDWFREGSATLAELKQAGGAGQAKNVILFVGDGMGVSTVTAARILDGQQRGGDGESHRLAFERLPYLAMSVTASANQQTSDSAPTATAMVTGIKANAGALSVAPRLARHQGVLGIFPRKRTKTAGALVILGLPEGVTSHFLTVLEYFG